MSRHAWLFPATASLAFFAYSLAVMVREGPFGFVVEHLRNGWGHQIFVDLVNCAGVALVLAAPLARRSGVRMAPWVVLTALTGSIGLLALMARLLYASRGDRQARPDPAPREREDQGLGAIGE